MAGRRYPVYRPTAALAISGKPLTAATCQRILYATWFKRGVGPANQLPIIQGSNLGGNATCAIFPLQLQCIPR